MKELALKYGTNPNQKPARIFMTEGELPVTVLNGRPGYINFLDALNSWQLVRELRQTLGRPAAASFKHVSPAGAAIGLPLLEGERKAFFIDNLTLDEINKSELACAYARARGTDRMSSFGDWIALSDPCDETTARVIQHEVSDGVIAPGYSDAALAILSSKRKGGYAVVQIDPNCNPPELERREIFGITFEQGRNTAPVVDPKLFDSPVTAGVGAIPESARRDMTLALIVLKYTQSNSVCYVRNGQTLGVGAGQQSRLHCTRLAGDKADLRLLREHPKVLNLPFKSGIGRPERDNAIDLYLNTCSADWPEYFADYFGDGNKPEPLSPTERREWLDSIRDVSLGSDAFFPFPDNIERARQSGVAFVAQPGGSIRDDLVVEACNQYGIAMVMTGQRLFHH